MEIKIENYLDHAEIKEIVADELRNQIRGHFTNEENAKRLLSNLAYHIVKEEINKIVPNYEQELLDKVVTIINDKNLGYQVFDFDTYGSGRSKSLGAQIVEETVRENKQLIKDKVIEGIQNRDYSDEAMIKLENLSDSFASNIYDFVELMRAKKE